MSPIVFSPGLSFVKEALALEEMRFFAEKWTLEFFQLEKGHFEGSWHSVHTPRIQLQRVVCSRGVLVRGSTPAECITFALVVSEEEEQFAHCTGIEKDTQVQWDAQEEVDYLNLHEGTLYTVSVELDLFREAFIRYFNEPFHRYGNLKRMAVVKGQSAALVKNLIYWLAYLEHIEGQGSQLLINKFYQDTEREILQQLFQCFELEERGHTVPKGSYQAADILTALNENVYDDTSTIATIAAGLKISERHMRHLLKTHLHISPKEYLQSMRLNMIKKELLQLRYGRGRIEDIARKYQFYHMGHFSAEYKKMFAELPSETLKQ